MMRKSNALAGAAIATVLAAGGLSPEPAQAKKITFEKCFGVANAGKNDCQTATSACAGTSRDDYQKDAWIYVPKGLCKKLAGGALD
jgi:uncharacterized membrane protein